MKKDEKVNNKKGYKKKYEDKRINAPFITWESYIAMFITVYLVIVGLAIIFDAYQDAIGTVVGALLYYMMVAGLVVVFIISIVRRKIYGKPIRKIAAAARKITQGDYSVRIEPNRKDGKKDEIEVLIEDFNRMAQELANTEILKNDFIANVSHEIKAPLSVIQSYTKILKDDSISRQQHDEYVDIVVGATNRLNTLITNVLKLSKLENQEIFPEPESYQLGEQLRKCALDYMDMWQEKEIDFFIDVVDEVVCYDKDLLGIVWSNLLSNAIKFTEPKGRISVISYKEKIQDSVEETFEEDAHIVVKITDSGCGMSKAVKERIFDKFYQGDTSHATQGNGLGLSLVGRILQILDARIEVDSVLGEGTTFTVFLNV